MSLTGDVPAATIGSIQSLSRIRRLYLVTAHAWVEMCSVPEVGSAWVQPSVLDGLSIGALVGHVCSGILRVESLLDSQAVSNGPLTSATEYYGTFTGGSSSFDERNRVARTRGASAAQNGQVTLLADVRACLNRMPSWLAGESEARHVELPGSPTIGSVSLLLDQYLKVRVVEQIIHSDDLARSVPYAARGVPDAEACSVAIETLVGAAVIRHGPRAVLHALARRELDEVQALRVL